MSVEKHDSQTTEMTRSNFHLYSIGTVAANKPRNTWNIEVTPDEKLPLVDKELTDNVEELEVKGSELSGATYESVAKAGNSIQATWLPYSDPNRITAPDVRRGMRVAIYRFADSPEYFWSTIHAINHLMRLETVTHVYSADPNNPISDDLSNCYVQQISTHDKLVTMIKTSKANGEPFAYVIQVNTNDGQVFITDDINNQFLINSPDNHIEMRNADGAVWQLIGQDAYHYTPGDSVEEIGGNKIIKTGGELSLKAGGSALLDSSGGTTVNSSSLTRIDGSSVSIG